ncbi:FAD-dependent oxidoreductase [Actinokineospora globicatena]|uniref:FAD-dependent oxidoreductase n=1 Tax=Actinokineospora globicatena TaxID=103729 RepID=UPI0020A5CD06|nr:FAD-dependent oxidoreductase [Actinokineospora globicatena]MCP2305724.1 sarcosine oxidase [Actinokineospora globicatena]GLW81596.1 N-methyltryptophan oxidase [Actinokineospora globicatena]GLW87706.1 N-methyltryptophan oxidase [Actinokineospora globicatena]
MTVSPRRTADVVVIGGGGVGSAAAWRLAARGTDVVLLERFTAGHVFGASHGASRIFRVTYSEPDYVELARRAHRLWLELESLTGKELLEITGGIDHGQVPLTALADAVARAGSPGSFVPVGEATERWPGIRFDGTVFFHPVSGTLDADAAVAALQSAAASAGAQIRHESPVKRLRVRNDLVEVDTDDGTVVARAAVVTVGAWSAKLLDAVLTLPPLRVTQEQPAYFAGATTGWPSFVHHIEDPYPSGVYGLATPGHGIKAGFHGVGPVVDPDNRDFLPEPGQLAALQDYARTWLPGVDPDTFTPISCTYTSTTNSDFILDRVGPVVVGAGFSGHGFKFLPAVGEVLADLATTGKRPAARFAL